MADEEQMANRRRSILTAAAALFDSRGYAATTIDQVAAQAGIAKGSVYNYFKSKYDLYTQLFSDAVADDEAEVDRAMCQPIPAAGKMNYLLDFWFQRLGHSKRVGRLTLEFWAMAARQPQTDAFTALLHGTYDRWIARISAIIAEGIARGEFRSLMDPRAAASLLVGLLNGLLLHMILNIGTEVDSAFLPKMKRAVMAALGIAPAGEGAAEEGQPA